MDEVDRSFYEEQSNTEDSVRLARLPTSSRLKPVGYCLTCYEDVAPAKLFCNNLCADEHNHIQRLSRLLH